MKHSNITEVLYILLILCLLLLMCSNWLNILNALHFDFHVCFYCKFQLDHFLKCFFLSSFFISLYCLNCSCFKVCYNISLKVWVDKFLIMRNKFCSNLKLFLIIIVFILAVRNIYSQHFLLICISDKLIRVNFHLVQTFKESDILVCEESC